jgi:hypothetical protein
VICPSPPQVEQLKLPRPLQVGQLILPLPLQEEQVLEVLACFLIVLCSAEATGSSTVAVISPKVGVGETVELSAGDSLGSAFLTKELDSFLSEAGFFFREGRTAKAIATLSRRSTTMVELVNQNFLDLNITANFNLILPTTIVYHFRTRMQLQKSERQPVLDVYALRVIAVKCHDNFGVSHKVF